MTILHMRLMVSTLKINKLSLKNFRNYQHFEQQFNKNMIIIVGDNAQGKTNIVESIYTLAFSKSYRTRFIKDLIQESCDFSKINAHIIFSDETTKQIEFIISQSGKKIKINGVEQKSKSDFLGLIKVIKFSPEDLDLIKGAPSVRRKFMDMYISQLDKQYFVNLLHYNHLIKQKNALLKKHTQNIELFRIYNKKIAEYIAYIHQARNLFYQHFFPIVYEVFNKIVDCNEILCVEYVSAFTNMDSSDIIEQYLNDHLSKEMKHCSSLFGIHRDELHFFINSKDAKKFGSQGQQRTIVLSLIIALVSYIQQQLAEYPILILDDVMSELDEQRRTHLLASFEKDMQIFLTTTSVEDIQQKINQTYELYHVVQGKINRVGEK